MVPRQIGIGRPVSVACARSTALTRASTASRSFGLERLALRRFRGAAAARASTERQHDYADETRLRMATSTYFTAAFSNETPRPPRARGARSDQDAAA